MLRALSVCLVLVLAIGSACERVAVKQASLGPEAEHVLNRIGYGPDAWSRERITKIGVDRYIEEQLRPAGIDDSALEEKLQRLVPSIDMTLAGIMRVYRPPHNRQSEARRELARAKLLRAIYSKRQLEQVLVDFWLNHFNVDARREIAVWAIGPYERDAIRPHVLGRFEDMLRAVAKHPAMLEYLDNSSNFREGYVFDEVEYGINENFARELLELHTVGPDTGRKLRDIHDTARAFTGWTIATPPYSFAFRLDGHDRGAKTILGLSLPAGGGVEDGEKLLRYLARHPDTAHRIAQKLCRRFVAEHETGCELVATARYLETNGDLRAVMREILFSAAFRDPRNFRTKAKRPLHWIASLARATGVADDRTFLEDALNELERMGEDLYGAGPPSGHPDVSSAWLGESSLLRKLTLASRVLRGGSGLRKPAALGTRDPFEVFRGVEARIVPSGVSAAVQREILAHLVRTAPAERLGEATALLLASPDFAHH